MQDNLTYTAEDSKGRQIGGFKEQALVGRTFHDRETHAIFRLVEFCWLDEANVWAYMFQQLRPDGLNGPPIILPIDPLDMADGETICNRRYHLLGR